MKEGILAALTGIGITWLLYLLYVYMQGVL